MDVAGAEQTKLLATGVNNIAVAFIVIGVVTLITAVSFGILNAPTPSLSSGFFVAVWLCTGAGLHYIARRVLRSLNP